MHPQINAAFNAFHSHIAPSAAERSAASQHRQSIINKLENSFGVGHSFETGSMGNGTGISGYADLDVFASIPSYSQRDSSITMLSVVRDALIQKFPHSSIQVRTPAIRCSFGVNDSEVVEIVPAYYQRTEDRDGAYVYKIPDFGGGYQLSAPRTHTNYVQQVNTQHNSKLKPLIRFIKAVKYYNDIPISSFYLEMRVAKWASDENMIDYCQDVRGFLAFLDNLNLAALTDPTGIAGYIYATSSDAKKTEAIGKIHTAAIRAQKAYDCARLGHDDQALQWWDTLYNGKF